MRNLKDVLYFKIPVRYFILDDDYVIHIGDTEFKYIGNTKIPPKEIASHFYKGLSMKVQYDIDYDNTQFVDFQINYVPDEKMLEGIRL